MAINPIWWLPISAATMCVCFCIAPHDKLYHPHTLSTHCSIFFRVLLWKNDKFLCCGTLNPLALLVFIFVFFSSHSHCSFHVHPMPWAGRFMKNAYRPQVLFRWLCWVRVFFFSLFRFFFLCPVVVFVVCLCLFSFTEDLFGSLNELRCMRWIGKKNNRLVKMNQGGKY